MTTSEESKPAEPETPPDTETEAEKRKRGLADAFWGGQVTSTVSTHVDPPRNQRKGLGLVSPAAEAELLASLSRQLERNEKMSEQLGELRTDLKVKSALDEERHRTLLNQISNVQTLVVEKTNKLDERVTKLEAREAALQEEAKKEAKEEVRYWARWAMATIVTFGFAILMAVVKLKQGLPTQENFRYALHDDARPGRYSRRVLPVQHLGFAIAFGDLADG